MPVNNQSYRNNDDLDDNNKNRMKNNYMVNQIKNSNSPELYVIIPSKQDYKNRKGIKS